MICLVIGLIILFAEGDVYVNPSMMQQDFVFYLFATAVVLIMSIDGWLTWHECVI